MMDPADKYPLLYQLFLRLQKYDRQLGHQALGVKAFYTLIGALNRGVGLSDEHHFKKLVRWLWRKPHHQKEVFNEILEEGLEHIYQRLKQESEKDEKTPVRDQKDKPDKKSPKGEKTTSEEQKTVTKKAKEQPSKIEDEPEPVEDSIIISFEKADPDKNEDGLKLDIENLSEQINRYGYFLEGNYFELGGRQLQQGIRTLRRRTPDKHRKVLDLEATIDKASRQGFLESLEYCYGQKWTTDLLVLVDQGDSMLAFEPFSRQLVDIIDRDYDIEKAIAFFKETPYQHVFLDRAQRNALAVSKIAEAPLQPVLIISDAGAATGRIDEFRVENTVDFLAQIRKHRVAWLNPMPRDRWRDTSAEYIAQYTSMFYIDPTELVNAVKLFKAKIRATTLLDRYVQTNR